MKNGRAKVKTAHRNFGPRFNEKRAICEHREDTYAEQVDPGFHKKWCNPAIARKQCNPGNENAPEGAQQGVKNRLRRIFTLVLGLGKLKLISSEMAKHDIIDVHCRCKEGTANSVS